MGKGRRELFRYSLREDPDTGVQVQRLSPSGHTCLRNYFYQKAFSSDGERLILGCDIDGALDLWLLELKSGLALQLSEGGTASIQGAYLSADERWVYFNRGRRAHVRLDLETLQEETVYTLPEGWLAYGTWEANRDTTRVAGIEMWAADRVSGLEGWERFAEQYRRRPRQRLIDIDIGSGDAQVVFEDRRFIGHPMYRPGDDGLMGFCHEGPHDLVDSRIWLVGRDGRGLRPARPGRAGEACMHEFWAPDGSRLFYVLYRKGEDRRRLCAYDPDREENIELMEIPPCAHLMCDPTGCLLAGDGAGQLGDVDDKAGFAFRPDPHIHLFDLRDKSERILCRHDSTWAVYDGNTQASHPHPSFTPDGGRVLFASDAEGLPALYLAELPDGVREKGRK